ncbi:hypothetical protein N510_000804 [Firmicutes bacterium ASF500]|nr:hypothetical protein N510_000804 [Firmicutes bacterium ASF500]
MGVMELSSQVTFLYFTDMKEAARFFDGVLQLEKVYDPGWACVWRTGPGAFVGAVDVDEGSIQVERRGGVLVSLTVRNIEAVREHILSAGLEPSPIKQVKELDLKSFFFTGPEGYEFEIQQFTSGDLSRLF